MTEICQWGSVVRAGYAEMSYLDVVPINVDSPKIGKVYFP